jgi:excisionase family DNA binding protein
MEKLTIRPHEAAKMLSISERTLFTWTKKEGLPCVKKGRITLYSIQDIVSWLEKMKKGEV